MNKIKQNKITFTIILTAILIIFSSLTILSLPVLFNYKSKVTIIEKNFYKNFKIFLNSSGKVTYKPFPKPHLLVENANLNLSNSFTNEGLINTKNLKIYLSLRDLYLRSFDNFVSTEISDTNFELKFIDIKEIRKHLYLNINKPIIFNNCKVFIRNKNNEVILISPIKKIFYKIDNKNKIKNFKVDGELFGLKYKSEWKRNYTKPKKSYHNISILNPNIEFKNILEIDDIKKIKSKIQVTLPQDKMEYDIQFNNGKIKISSPNNKKINFNLDSEVNLAPFYFEGGLKIKKKSIEKIIDNFLHFLLSKNQDYLGNFNGKLNITLDKINNKLIKKGEINLNIKEKIINVNKARFILDKVGYINTNINFIEEDGHVKFLSRNELNIENYIEFAKIFQIGSKKVKNIKHIYFVIEKNLGETDFIIKNVKINKKENSKIESEIFLVNNIQNLRSYIRKILN